MLTEDGGEPDPWPDNVQAASRHDRNDTLREMHMNVHILSDLHLERRLYDVSETARKADLIILAGDIHEGTQGMAWAATQFDCKVLYVAGNHEYYHGHLEKTLDALRTASNDHVQFLEQQELVLEGVRFLGSTGWTDFSALGNSSASAWATRQRYGDFDAIRAANGRWVQQADFSELNHNARQWLAERLSIPFEGPTVVITHYAPSARSMSPQETLVAADASFFNHWDDLFRAAVPLWIHGHTHMAVDYLQSGTRVLSNPRGTRDEVTGFSGDCQVALVQPGQ